MNEQTYLGKYPKSYKLYETIKYNYFNHLESTFMKKLRWDLLKTTGCFQAVANCPQYEAHLKKKISPDISTFINLKMVFRFRTRCANRGAHDEGEWERRVGL